MVVGGARARVWFDPRTGEATRIGKFPPNFASHRHKARNRATT
jgi:hypothetical protein